nr:MULTISPECIES: hypothetical protein [Bacillus]
MKKTTKMMAGVMATLMTVTTTACENESRPDKPKDTSCDDWEWDKETGTYYCDDSSSSVYRSYYHGGRVYKSKTSLKADDTYKTYKSSYKSGIGSGTKGGFGG